MSVEVLDTKMVYQVTDHLYDGVTDIIDNARTQVSVYVNAHASMTFWSVGRYIIDDMEYRTYSAYGQKILATLSQRLMARYGKGYTYSALTRMLKVARMYNDKEMFAKLSQTLSWSHFIELITIKDVTIDLKLGKFKPQYKGQMELYLKYLERYDMQPDEKLPIGLLLCSEVI